MESRNTIVEELIALYPAVANLSRKNVYSIPPYYFETLAEAILNRIKDEKEQKVLKSPSVMPFNVPAQYFESLAANILERVKSTSKANEIVDELNLIAPLLSTISRQPVYSVPNGYFENLKLDSLRNSEIVRELDEIAPLLNTISKQSVYTVPDGYFNNLKAGMFRSVEIATELNEIAPVLNTISKQPVYSVPAGYFQNLKVPIPMANKRPALSFIRGGAKVIRYAAAAVVTGIIGTASYFFLTEETAVKPQATTEQISFKQEQIKKLSDQEIIEYLNSTSSSLDVATRPADDSQDDLFDNSIEEMSDEEIKEYLKEYGEPTELHKKEG